MGQMFVQFFAFITTMFVALNKLGNAANSMATIAEESAGAMEDEARYNRQQKLKALLESEGIDALPKAEPKRIGVAKTKAAAST